MATSAESNTFAALASASASRSPDLAKWALLFAAVLLAYYPALHGGFVWDDAAHVTAPALRSLDGLRRIWTEPGATQQYYPLLHSAFWLEHRLFGDAPLGYHLVNVLLHATAAGLFLLALEQLALPGALVAALLFALHPVQVESVAWISEQKNTLSLVLYLGAAFAYLRFTTTRARSSYLCATALFVAALLTKSVTATLPATLGVITWWQTGRLSWSRHVVPLLPWFIVGSVAGAFTATVEHSLVGATDATFAVAPLQRGLLAGAAWWFYLGRLAWPAHLAFVYPRWQIEPLNAWQWLPVAAWLLLGLLLWRRRRHARGPFAVYACFTAALSPALGFVNVYPFRYSFVADHFQYVATLPAFAGVVAFLARRIGRSPWPAFAAVALGIVAWNQAHAYRDVVTLYRTSLSVNPDSWMVCNNLGKELMGAPAHREESIRLFERALALRPDYFEAHNNLGLVLTQAGRSGEALPHLQAAAKLNPVSPEAQNNLGIALASSGRAEQAVVAFARAAALNPRLANIQENWAKALLLLNRRSEAEVHFAIAARLRQNAEPSLPSVRSPLR